MEALNYEIKLIMNRAMTQYNSKDAAKFLPLALDVHNSSESSGLPSGMTPNDADRFENIAKVQHFRLKRRAAFAQKMAKKYPVPKFAIGDEVRKIEPVKGGRARGFKPRFSETLYKVIRVSKTMPRMYDIGLYKAGRPHMFYKNELTLAHERKSDNPGVLAILGSRNVATSKLRNGKVSSFERQYLTSIDGNEKPVYLTKDEIEGYKNGSTKLSEFLQDGQRH